MSNKFYAPLGPPPKQPRRLTFVPKNGRKGEGKVEKDLENLPTKIRNLEILNGYVDSDRKSIKAGDVLIAAKPFVCILSTSCRGFRCENCFKKLDRKKSPVVCECKFAYFCSNECRDTDELHAEECLLFQRRGKGPTSDIARYVLRAILKIRAGGLAEADTVPGMEEPRKFSHLVDHFDDILDLSGHRREITEQIYTEVLDFMGEEDGPDPDYFLTIYGRIAVNSFSIIDGIEQDSIGSGLYLGPSIFDHSCVPNAAVTFLPDKTIVVRALDDFPDANLGQFFITYIDLMDYTEHRRHHLLKNYYFLCQCPRCCDQETDRQMFSMVCKNCQAPEIYISGLENPEKEFECSKCSTRCAEADRENYVEISEIVRDKLNDVVVPLDVANFCLNQMNRVGFGPFHILVVQATIAAFEGALFMFEKSHRNMDLLKRAHHCGLFLIEAYEKYRRNKYWACQGLFLAKMSQIEKELGFAELAVVHLAKADEILKVAYGGNVLRGFDCLASLNGDA